MKFFVGLIITSNISMLHYSKTAGYAIHALSCIGAGSPQPSLIRDIAKRTRMQKPYLAKIINQLTHHGLIKARRGCQGGVLLSRPPEEISLFQIVQAVEKPNQTICLFGLSRCPCNGLCPAHKQWCQMRNQVETILRSTMLSAVMATTPRAKNGAKAR
jgi:Rrf2 family protein